MNFDFSDDQKLLRDQTRRFLAERCGIDAPRPCACTSVELPGPTLAALRARYTGCLCVACLRALAHGASVAG